MQLSDSHGPYAAVGSCSTDLHVVSLYYRFQTLHFVHCLLERTEQDGSSGPVQRTETEAGAREAILLKKILTGSVTVLAALSHKVSSRKPSGNVCDTKGTERD